MRNVSNKATGMFNKSEPLEAYLSKVSGTPWDETRCSVDSWKPFQTWVKLVLLYNVDRALVIYS